MILLRRSDLDRKAWWCLMVSSSYVDESLRLRGSCLLGSSGPELRGMSMLLRLRWRLPSRVGEDGGARTLLMMMPGDRRSVSWDRRGGEEKQEQKQLVNVHPRFVDVSR